MLEHRLREIQRPLAKLRTRPRETIALLDGASPTRTQALELGRRPEAAEHVAAVQFPEPSCARRLEVDALRHRAFGPASRGSTCGSCGRCSAEVALAVAPRARRAARSTPASASRDDVLDRRRRRPSSLPSRSIVSVAEAPDPSRASARAPRSRFDPSGQEARCSASVGRLDQRLLAVDALVGLPRRELLHLAARRRDQLRILAAVATQDARTLHMRMSVITDRSSLKT